MSNSSGGFLNVRGKAAGMASSAVSAAKRKGGEVRGKLNNHGISNKSVVVILLLILLLILLVLYYLVPLLHNYFDQSPSPSPPPAGGPPPPAPTSPSPVGGAPSDENCIRPTGEGNISRYDFTHVQEGNLSMDGFNVQNIRCIDSPSPAAASVCLGPGQPYILHGCGDDYIMQFCQGDFNRDGTIGTREVLTMLSLLGGLNPDTTVYGTDAAAASLYRPAVTHDLNHDGQINTEDLLLLLAKYGRCHCGPGQSDTGIEGCGEGSCSNIVTNSSMLQDLGIRIEEKSDCDNTPDCTLNITCNSAGDNVESVECRNGVISPRQNPCIVSRSPASSAAAEAGGGG